MKRFEVTITYKAVIAVDVKAENEEDARKLGLQKFKDLERKKWYRRRDINLQDDTYKVSGAVNMSETWDML